MFKPWPFIALAIVSVGLIVAGSIGNYAIDKFAPQNSVSDEIHVLLRQEIEAHWRSTEYDADFLNTIENAAIKLDLLNREYKTMRGGVVMWNRSAQGLGILCLIVLAIGFYDSRKKRFSD